MRQRCHRSVRTVSAARVITVIVVATVLLAGIARAGLEVQAVTDDLGEITPGATVRLTLRLDNPSERSVEVVPVVQLPSSWSLVQPAPGIVVAPGARRVVSLIAASSASTPAGPFEINVALVAGADTLAQQRFSGSVRQVRDVRWRVTEQTSGIVLERDMYVLEATLINDGNETLDVLLRGVTNGPASVLVRPDAAALPPGASVDVRVELRLDDPSGFVRQRLRLEAVDRGSGASVASIEATAEFAAAVAFGEERDRRFRLVIDTALQVPDVARGVSGRAFGIGISGGGALDAANSRSLFGSVRLTGTPSLVGNVTYRDGPLTVVAAASTASGFSVRARYGLQDAEASGFVVIEPSAREARIGADYVFSIDEVTRARVAFESDLSVAGSALSGALNTVLGQRVSVNGDGVTERRGGVAFGGSARVSGAGDVGVDVSASADLGAVGVGAFAGTTTSVFGSILRGGASASLGLADVINVPIAFSARVSGLQQTVAGFGPISTSVAWAAGGTLGLGPIAAAASIGERTDAHLVDALTTVTRDVNVAAEALLAAVRFGTQYGLTTETSTAGTTLSVSRFGVRWALPIENSDARGQLDLVRESGIDQDAVIVDERTFSGAFSVTSAIANGTLEPRLTFKTTRSQPGFDEIVGRLAADLAFGDDARLEPAVSFTRTPGLTRFGAQAAWRDRVSDGVTASVAASVSVGGGAPAYTLAGSVSSQLESEQVLRGNVSLAVGGGARTVGFGLGYLVPVGFVSGEFGGVGNVVGRIVDEFRRPVAGVLLELNGLVAATDADGAFRFEGVPVGSYRLGLRDTPSPDVAFTPRLPVQVDVVDAGTQTIVIERTPAATIGGTVQLREMPASPGVIYGSGSPVRDLQAAMQLIVELRNGERSARASVGADGKFEFRGLAAGTYDLVVDASALDDVLYRVEPLRQVVVVQPGARATVLVDLVPLPRSVEIQNGR